MTRPANDNPPIVQATPAQVAAFDAWIAASALGMDTAAPLAELDRVTPARPLGATAQSFVARLLPSDPSAAVARFGGVA